MNAIAEAGTRPVVPMRRVVAVVAVALSLVVAACGTNKPAASSGGGGAAASASPGSSAGGSAGGSAGASAGSGNTGAPIAEGAAKGDLTIWAMGAEGEKLGQLAKDFEAKNPGVKIKVTPIGWDVAHDKILTAIAANQLPDTGMVGTTWMGEFGQAGALDAVPSNFDVSDFFPGAWPTAVVNGTALGVPWYVETRLLYYRTDIAKKAGITAAPATWEDLKADAQAMKDKGGAQAAIALQPGGQGSWQQFMPLVWSNGGDILGPDGKFTLDTPQALEALTYWQSFFNDGLAPKTQATGFDVTPAFVRGTHPMFFSGPWHLGLLKDAGGAPFASKWDIAPMPKKVTATSFVGGSDFVVYKTSKNRDTAWKFVQFLSQPDVQAKWYGVTGDLPAVQAAWKTGDLASDPKLTLFGQQLKDAKAPPAIPHWEEIASAIDDELAKVASGTEDPAAALKAMQEKATSIGGQ
jgi:multiple sugar transport system substrate-binding protein